MKNEKETEKKVMGSPNWYKLNGLVYWEIEKRNIDSFEVTLCTYGKYRITNLKTGAYEWRSIPPDEMDWDNIEEDFEYIRDQLENYPEYFAKELFEKE